jgi:hypothetical protein
MVSTFFTNILKLISMTVIRKNYNKFDKKPILFKTPDLSKMQEVVIDVRTRIYIAPGADPVKAKERYLARIEAKGKVFIGTKT